MKLAQRYGTTESAPAPVVAVPDAVVMGPRLVPAPRTSGDIWSPKVDAVPRNAVTGADYRGGNVVRLLAAEAEHGYRSGAGWAGFGQWRSIGRVVMKGEHGTACIAVTSGGKEADDKPRKGRGVRGFRVFHYDQTTELVEGAGAERGRSNGHSADRGARARATTFTTAERSALTSWRISPTRAPRSAAGSSSTTWCSWTRVDGWAPARVPTLRARMCGISSPMATVSSSSSREPAVNVGNSAGVRSPRFG